MYKLLLSFFSKFCWGHVKCTFVNPSIFFFAKKPDIFAQRPKTLKYLLFFPKNFKMFRCTRRLQFWQSCQKIQRKSPIISLNEQKAWAKFFPSKEASQKCSPENVECSFDNPTSVFYPLKKFHSKKNVLKLFLWTRKM